MHHLSIKLLCVWYCIKKITLISNRMCLFNSGFKQTLNSYQYFFSFLEGILIPIFLLLLFLLKVRLCFRIKTICSIKLLVSLVINVSCCDMEYLLANDKLCYVNMWISFNFGSIFFYLQRVWINLKAEAAATTSGLTITEKQYSARK